MSVRRVMGTETEYGISVPSLPSHQRDAGVVPDRQHLREPRRSARARALGLRGGEPAARRARLRGHVRRRPTTRPRRPTRTTSGLANVILTNGARFYVDHAHPEYSAPEVLTPRDAVLWDKAGERVMAEAARRAARVPGTAPINLYKNNTDNKGVSYGTPRELPDGPVDAVRRHRPAPDAVLRQPPGRHRRRPGRHRRRRSTGRVPARRSAPTSSRSRSASRPRSSGPIINTRDEPHADPEKYRRLHVIIGDANLSEISTYLKVGHDLAGHRDDRGRLARRRPDRRRAGGRAARGLARPGAALADDAARRPEDDRAAAADGVPRAGPQVRRGPLRCRRRRPDPRRPRALGVGADAARGRSAEPAPASSTGWRSCRCSRATATATAWTGTRPGCSSSTCSTATSGRRRASTTGSSRGAGSSGCSTEDEIAPGDDRRRRRTPAPTSAAGAWRSTPSRSPPRPGTR